MVCNWLSVPLHDSTHRSTVLHKKPQKARICCVNHVLLISVTYGTGSGFIHLIQSFDPVMYTDGDRSYKMTRLHKNSALLRIMILAHFTDL